MRIISCLLVLLSSFTFYSQFNNSIILGELCEDSLEVQELLVPRKFTHLQEDVVGFKNVTKITLSHQVNWSKTIDVLVSFPKLTSLVLIDAQLETIPDSIVKLKKLKTLVISDNKIPLIPKFLEELTNLEEINLRDNAIDSIACDFSKFSKLRLLDIATNKIRLLEISNPLSNIEIIEIQNNRLSFLSDNFFMSKKLKEFKCGNNNLEFLSSIIGENKQLKIINVKNNKFKALPNSLGNCKQLNYLNVSGNEISEMQFISNLSQLKTIKISGNNLNIFPVIVNPATVEIYEIGDNKISVLPRSLVDYSALKILDVSFNNIASIEEIKGLCTLRKFFAIENKVEKVEFSGSCLNELQELVLNGNLLTTFKVGSDELGALKVLELRSNQLSDNGVEFKLDSLLKIDIGENNFQNVPKSILKSSTIQKIDISYNPISILKEELFYLNSIQKIECQSCNISTFPTLLKTSDLIELFLGRNTISSIDLSNFSKLEEVELSNNPISKLLLNQTYKLKILEISNTIISDLDIELLTKRVELLINSEDKEELIEEND